MEGEKVTVATSIWSTLTTTSNLTSRTSSHFSNLIADIMKKFHLATRRHMMQIEEVTSYVLTFSETGVAGISTTAAMSTHRKFVPTL